MIGELIDHYRVLELVGRGAMGVVYQALDVNLDRRVAIKVMSVEARGDPDFVERFRQEARMQGALNHPNVALLFDYFIHDGTPVAVMEFIDGESLEQLIRRRGPIPAHEAIPIFKQALRGVAAAHRAGIIHRDLKPGNLMVTKDDVVKVMDFGIAKRQGVTGATKVSSTSIGSPLYMAPEQILGRPVDCRTDVYALGITLYELLSAQRPFNARGKAEYLILNAHVNDLPEPPTVYRYGIPQPIVDAVMRSLAKEPDARFQSAEEFMSALPEAPAPNVAAPRVAPTGTVAIPHEGPTGTVAIPHEGPTGTVAIPRTAPSATVALEYSPTLALEKSPPMSGDPVAAREPSGTTAFEYAPSTGRDPHDSMAFDYSAGTVWQQLHPTRSAPRLAATASPEVAADVAPAGTALMQLLRAHRLGIVAVLVATLGLGTLLRHSDRLHAMPPDTSPASSGPHFTHARASTVPQARASTEPAAPPAVPSSGADALSAPSADRTAAAAVPATATPPASAAAPAPDLAGTWRGAYVDASGKQLLRVVSLSISRVHDDGGIDGTLQYEAASGDGECKLHPRGSTYSVADQRLQLSPEGCSPHYPKELGVPLDFDGVKPQAKTLVNGRVEAPTGEVIRVRLQRMGGA
jgi:serine/threonine protein kinase